MKVAIAGASGLVGTALTKHLTESSHTVEALKRKPGGGADDAFEGVTPGYLESFDAVINLAGENIAGKRWTPAQKQLLLTSRTHTTSFLAKTLSQTKDKPTVFVNCSAVGIYGDRGPDIMTEDSAPGSGFLPTVCKEWESAAEPAKRPGLRLVLARLGIVISKDGGALQKMLLPFKMGAGGILGSGRQYMSWISIVDVVRIFEFLLTHEAINGPVNLVAPDPVTNAQFTETMGKVLHRPTILPAPAAALQLILGEMAQEMLLEGTRVQPAKLEAAGYKFEYPNLEKALEREVK